MNNIQIFFKTPNNICIHICYFCIVAFFIEPTVFTHIAHNVGTLPTKKGFIKIGKLRSEFSKVIRNPDTVRNCTNSVLQIFEVAVELRRIVCIGYNS